MNRSTRGPEADVQCGWVKLHINILKDGKRRAREDGISRQNDQHMQTQGTMTLSGKLQVI